jgi:hypothetical protein
MTRTPIPIFTIQNVLRMPHSLQGGRYGAFTRYRVLRKLGEKYF